MDRTPIRETGSSDLSRVPIAGHFDGLTRRGAMNRLLSADIEKRICTPWRLRVRMRLAKAFPRVFRLALLIIAIAATGHAQERQSMTSRSARLTPQQAADILRPNQFVARPPLPDGPTVIIVRSTPGALTWLPFPPEPPRRRLDGTLLDSRPPDHFWNAPVLTHRR